MDRKGLPILNKCKQDEFWSFDDNMIIECPCPPSQKGVYHQENQKIHQKFQLLFKANLILLANMPTPNHYTDSWPCLVLLKVTTCRPVAFCNLPTQPTQKKHSCNNIKIHYNGVYLSTTYIFQKIELMQSTENVEKWKF